MKDEAQERRRYLLWGIPASLILHVLVAALLVYGLPIPPQQPQEEQPVNVALVPPPDQPRPKPVPPPKPPEVEKPPEQKVERPPPPEKQARKPPPVEALRPVFQFGDKDAGPRKSLDGASAQDNSPSPAKDDASKPPVEPKPAENQPATPPDTEQQADPAKADEKSVSQPTEVKPPQDADKQAALDAAKQQGAVPAPLVADGEIELPMSAEAPKPKPANAPKPSPSKASKSASQRASDLQGVRRLYSQDATGDALATTSMGRVARDRRVADLCASTLGQQLRDASYLPDLLPNIRWKVANIVNAPDVAFREGTTTWYHLGFRCEVDTDATRVLSFDFRVGPVIPRNEWARLGLY